MARGTKGPRPIKAIIYPQLIRSLSPMTVELPRHHHAVETRYIGAIVSAPRATPLATTATSAVPCQPPCPAPRARSPRVRALRRSVPGPTHACSPPELRHVHMLTIPALSPPPRCIPSMSKLLILCAFVLDEVYYKYLYIRIIYILEIFVYL
jgi:hypothetical protein